MKVTVVDGDLLDQDVDVIVTAWNRNIIPWWLLIPQGVSGAIKKRAGLQPFRELGRMGAIPLGHAVETSAGTLSFKDHSCRWNQHALAIVGKVDSRCDAKLAFDCAKPRVPIAGDAIDWGWFWRRQFSESTVDQPRRVDQVPIRWRGSHCPVRQDREGRGDEPSVTIICRSQAPAAGRRSANCRIFRPLIQVQRRQHPRRA